MSAHATAIPATAGALGDRVEQLIAAIEALSALLDEETRAVRARDYRRLEAMSEQKSALAETYGRQLRAVAAARSPGDRLDAGLGRRLGARARTFLGLVEANARALGAAKTAHEKVIRAISDAVAARARPTRGYSRTGGYGSARPGPGTSAPIALNQSI